MTRVLSLDEVAKAEAPELLVGRKAAGLGKLIALGMPVPPGFVVTTDVFRELERHGTLLEETRDAIRDALIDLEVRTGKTLGDGDAPLLVAVRSGAPVSMPGMMETILDVGMNPSSMAAIARTTGDRRFALDCMRRFVEGFGKSALGVPPGRLEAPVAARKLARGTPRARDAELGEADLEAIVEEQRRVIEHEVGIALPDDPMTQLELAIVAVLRSWHLPRAVRYRRLHGYGDRLGTACIVQAMAFGNRDDASGAGVLFTRHPSTGEPHITGEYAPRGQGTDVVDGTERPLPIDARSATPGSEGESLERRSPEIFAELARIAEILERTLGDAQEVELAFEAGKVMLLQTRPMKRSARAGVRIAVDLVRHGVVDEAGALATVDASSFATLFRKRLPSVEELAMGGIAPIARGLAASPGAASGRLVFTPDDAVRLAADGEDVILIRRDTSPEDVHGVKVAVGLVTTAGGLTSHAAVVARGLGRACVAGCTSIFVDDVRRVATIRRDGTSVELHAGAMITIDGSSGLVYDGLVDAIHEPESPELGTVLAWANAHRRLRVHAVAESPSRAIAALRAGADGIGLFSCDSLLNDEVARFSARCILLADIDSDESIRHEASLELALAAQLEPVVAIEGGRLIVLRLFDDVVGSLVDVDELDIERISASIGESRREVIRRVRALVPTRPGLGLRGVRLGLTHPGLVRALVRAVLMVRSTFMARGASPRLELVVPAVATGRELAALLGPIRDVLRRPGRDGIVAADLPIGAVIGIPHACLEAREIATMSEFIVFDTHELTQTVFGMSRDDSRTYLSRYIHDLHIFDADPFVRFDETGVGVLIRMGAEQARDANPGIRLEIAGEVAGEPGAARLAEAFGMDAIACPVDRMLVARVAAAQAVLAAASRRTLPAPPE